MSQDFGTTVTTSLNCLCFADQYLLLSVFSQTDPLNDCPVDRLTDCKARAETEDHSSRDVNTGFFVKRFSFVENQFQTGFWFQ